MPASPAACERKMAAGLRFSMRNRKDMKLAAVFTFVAANSLDYDAAQEGSAARGLRKPNDTVPMNRCKYSAPVRAYQPPLRGPLQGPHRGMLRCCAMKNNWLARASKFLQSDCIETIQYCMQKDAWSLARTRPGF